jgi:ArsR family transcriptional regulator, lead/cadmium/zinc/bismuth-responsive transcriptional repressor
MAATKKTKPSPTSDDHDHAHDHDHELTVDDETFERAASFFRAAGDVSRLKVLARLATGEWCVSELAEIAGVGMSTVSQQLRLLRAERMVKRHRDGKHMFYRLADSHVRRLVQAALAHAGHVEH